MLCHNIVLIGNVQLDDIYMRCIEYITAIHIYIYINITSLSYFFF